MGVNGSVPDYQWHQGYFLGLSKFPIKDMALNSTLMLNLLRLIGAGPSLSTGAFIHPAHLFHSKVISPWLVLETLLKINDQQALTEIWDGKRSVVIPPEILFGMFRGQRDWPERIRYNYDIELVGFNPCIVPFMLPNPHDIQPCLQLTRSLIMPDGNVELFGVYLLDPDNPEQLLMQLEGELDFIKQYRHDVFGH